MTTKPDQPASETPTNWDDKARKVLSDAKFIACQSSTSYPSRTASKHVRKVVAGLLNIYEEVCHDIALQNKQLAESQSELAKVKAENGKLRRYVDHTTKCSDDPRSKCTCGLEELLK